MRDAALLIFQQNLSLNHRGTQHFSHVTFDIKSAEEQRTRMPLTHFDQINRLYNFFLCDRHFQF